jgi:hypothetical protein
MRTIEQIAKERDEARIAYKCVAVMNVVNLSPEERIDLDVLFARRQAELMRLDSEYSNWIRNAAALAREGS